MDGRKTYTSCGAAQILSVAGFGFMLPFLPFFIQEIGISDPNELRRWVGISASIPALCMAGMAPVWGLLADRFGRKIMILRAMAAGSAILLCMSFVHSIHGILIVRVFQGLLTGTVTASATLVAVGTPKEKLSYALGFLASSTFIGFSLGPFLGGLIGEYFGYRKAFQIGAGILFVGFCVVLFSVREVRLEDTAENSAGHSEKNPLKKGFVILLMVLLGSLSFWCGSAGLFHILFCPLLFRR